MKFNDLDIERKKALMMINVMLNITLAKLEDITELSSDWYREYFNNIALSLVNTIAYEDIEKQLTLFDAMIDKEIKDKNENKKA